jgi:hypothetical protein
MSHMLSEDKYFQSFSKAELWQRYCGFLDLSVSEFLEIQRELLMDEIERVADSTVGKKIMGGKTPRSIEEFQRIVPLTSYEDYAPYLSEKQEAALAEKPYTWCHSSGKGGAYKWVPLTEECLLKAIRNFIASCILSSAEKRGEVNIYPGFTLLATLPPPPYTSGTIYEFLSKQLSFAPIPPPELVEDLEFREKMQKGFQVALKEGVDILGAISSVLVRMGQEFSSQARDRKFSASMLHPKIVWRMLRAVLRSKLEKRPLLPKDLWSPKGIVAGGLDTFIYKEEIEHYWGAKPFDFYVSTETLFIAMQGWNKKAMTFIADSVFFEFLPLGEENAAPVLLDGLEEGKLYEVIVTQLYGMPLLRYRINDIIRVISLTDEETGVKLPQIAVQRKVGQTIDLAGLASLDERIVWKAIANSGLRYTDWVACKEYDHIETYLRLYLELKEDRPVDQVETLIHQELQQVDPDYLDIERYLKQQPVKATLLPAGTFGRYMEEKQRQGADLAHLKPTHINPSAEMIELLLSLGKENPPQ